jgi:hypothetical protein
VLGQELVGAGAVGREQQPVSQRNPRSASVGWTVTRDCCAW